MTSILHAGMTHKSHENTLHYQNIWSTRLEKTDWDALFIHNWNQQKYDKEIKLLFCRWVNAMEEATVL